jgi:hypothetical protein
MEGVAVAASRCGEFGDTGAARGDVFGDAQGRGYVQAPRGGQVQHPGEVRGVVLGGAGLGGAGLGDTGLGDTALGRAGPGRVVSRVPIRSLFYHRDVPPLFPLPAPIRSVSILPGRGGPGLGEKGHSRHGGEPAGLAWVSGPARV